METRTAPFINPPRRAIKLSEPKKPVPNWHILVRPPMSNSNPRKSSLEQQMEEDLVELKEALDLFLDNKMNEAEALVRRKETMYFKFGQAMLDAIKAIITFHPDKIQTAKKSFDAAIKKAEELRKPSTYGLGTVKSLGSWVIGTTGAGAFKHMTRPEKHAELVYAEATVLRAGFSVLYHQDFWALLDEAINLRAAFAIFNGLKEHFESAEHELKAGMDISEYYLDEHLLTGLTVAISLFNIVISFMPDSIIRLLQFVGFPSDREYGLGLLNMAGNWDPDALPDTPEELRVRLMDSNNDGIRRVVCDVIPMVIHLYVSAYLPLKHVDYAFAERINNYNLYKHPNSLVFQFFKARIAQVNTRLDEAIAIHESIEVQPEWKNLKHACVFEQLMCAMMESDYDLACTKSRLLLRESNWTKCIFRYLAAVTTMKRGLAKEAHQVDKLMAKVEAGKQTFCGIEVFAETYCVRKANRYLKEKQLVLADYDFLVLWNAFDMMPMKSLRVAFNNIKKEVDRLEALLPPSMLAIADRPLPKNDLTIEATKGLSRLWSGVHSLTQADKVKGYDMFYDDYCIAHYLLGLISEKIAFFPNEVHDYTMANLAVGSFKTVFRYAPYIKDDTYAYYFSHYHMGLILVKQGRLQEAELRFKYLLDTVNPTLLSLPALAAGKGRNSLEVLVFAKAHAAMYLIIEEREAGRLSSSTNATTISSSTTNSSIDLHISKSSTTNLVMQDHRANHSGVLPRPIGSAVADPIPSQRAMPPVSPYSPVAAMHTTSFNRVHELDRRESKDSFLDGI
ncbi:hypothetical protein BGW42_000034 [Actinomortierella wolfii]|nr:hypothetical protein BGW42_000034 [Actinomortierella wolfii]